MRLPLHAIIIGINDYPDFATLTSAVSDAQKTQQCIKEVLKAEEKNINFLEGSAATKENIINAISSLTNRANRNDAILFFFSGYAGRAGTDDGDEGIICPVDVSKAGGISDRLLLQLFDRVSKSCGNNITLILDCPANIFKWNNPTSFVVVAPDTAKDTPNGGAFTQAMLKVLKDNEALIPLMTVQSFSGHVESEMHDVRVHSIGINVKRPLFNMKAEKGHHTFIPGRPLEDSISLCAGEAHGVRVGAIYGIYRSNLRGDLSRLGGLKVLRLNDDDITATLADPSVKFQIPSYFYAVEEDRYFDPIKIFVPEGTETKDLDTLSGWTKVTEPEANITAKVVGQEVSFRWHGFADDIQVKDARSGDRESSDLAIIQREIRRAARFHSLLAAPSPAQSLVSKNLRVRFVTDGSPDKNLFEDEIFHPKRTIKLKLEEDDIFGPYSLIICNDNPFPVWPHVFMCDPEGFIIRVWYLPPPGLSESPLQANGEFVIGNKNSEFRIMLSYMEDRSYDFTYLKIFVTKERTDFASFQQWYASQTEDIVRGHQRTEKDLVSSNGAQDAVLSPAKERERKLKIKVANWASMRLLSY